MKLSVVGTGYVGLVAGACFADLGHDVWCADQDEERVTGLRRGRLPFFEPGLDELVRRNVDGRLQFTASVEDAVRHGDVVFITVGTPVSDRGDLELRAVADVTERVARALDRYKVIVEKSTVPVQTGRFIRETIRQMAGSGADFDVACNPEFLREGSAVTDFLHPDRIVVGVETERAKALLQRIYDGFDCPLIVTTIETAELIKHAANAFLATKISYANYLAGLCERMGADVTQVADALGLDDRIGPAFLNAGVGYGGSCLPKDLSAFVRIGQQMGADVSLLRAVQAINVAQRRLPVEHLRRTLLSLAGRTVAVLGLAFKPNTDDVREAPATEIIRGLRDEGALVRAYDPQAMPRMRDVLPDVTYCEGPYDAVDGADALVLVTEWEEFRALDLVRVKRAMRRPVVFDGRNLFDPRRMAEVGFIYKGVGR